MSVLRQVAGYYSRIVHAPQAQEIEGCQLAHRRLLSLVETIDPASFSSASLMPGWSVAHVLTHLALNAEAMCRRINAAAQNEIVDQYAGGHEGRANEINIGAARSPKEIKSDLKRWCDALDSTFESIDALVWDRPVRTISGEEHPVRLLPFRRWREVEVHMVDLQAEFRPQDWSDALVAAALPRLIDGLAGRADDRELMAWLLGRGPAPSLESWG